MTAATSPSLTLPLSGHHLLEAAAGTGKTHAIKTLFGRLILEKNFPIGSILTVTYTEAAAKELKDRVRSSLEALLSILETGLPSDDPVENQLLSNLSTLSPEESCRRLRRALRDFDEAMISTIHGFCARILRDYAFENRCPYGQTIIESAQELIRDIVMDYWRMNFYHSSATTAALLTASKITPDSMATEIGKIMEQPGVTLDAVRQSAPDYAAAELRLANLAKAWSADRDNIINLIAASPALSRNKNQKNNYADETVVSHAEALDLATEHNAWIPQAIESLKLFSAGALLAGCKPSSLKKGEGPPTHPFFDMAENWCDEQTRLHRALFLDCREFVMSKFASIRENDGLITYADLLTDLYKVLDPATPDGINSALTIRQRFKAALIDEFQDTDPIQYGIFERLFGDAEFPLFLVGDPKQAIYAFRGADIRTYMKAKRNTPQHWSLNTNYRSEARLVEAVNELFGRPDFSPFANPDVVYDTNILSAGNIEKTGQILRSDGRTDTQPLKLVFPTAALVESLGEQTKKNGSTFAETFVASEIGRLLNNPSCRLGNRRIRPSDIAVLVAVNKNGTAMRDALTRYGIPAVPIRNDSVFDSNEAQNMLQLAAALLHWESPQMVRTVMCTDLFGEKASALMNNETVENYCARFRQSMEEWRSTGFITAFYRLMTDFGIRERLVSLPDGERRLTNYLHLAELLHRHDLTRRAELGDVTRFFRSGRNEINDESSEIRLESDSDSVAIVTIHKSKGLQFPITFIPYSFCRWGIQDDSLIRYHDAESGEPRLSFSWLRPEPSVLKAAADETLSEKLRLLYVAITRAQNRCYVIQYPVNRKRDIDTSMAHLFGEWSGDKAMPCPSSAIEKVAVDELPTPETWHDETSDAALIAPPSPRRCHASWRMLSFTAITGRHEAAGYEYSVPDSDIDDETQELIYASDTRTEDHEFSRSVDDIPELFPPGANTGNCWHKFFEELDFREPSLRRIRELAMSVLTRFGLNGQTEREQTERCEAMVRMAESVGSMPLLPDLHLADIPRRDMMRELRFCYRTNEAALQSKELSRLLEHYSDAQRPYRISDQEISEIPPNSIMTGAVDLAFRRNGKFYILDWKSNRINGSYSSFLSDGLTTEMQRCRYCLQYLLYIVALNRHLERTMKDYCYERNFGGVFYVFLRGVRPHRPDYGIFRDVIPPPGLIRELEERIPEKLL